MKRLTVLSSSEAKSFLQRWPDLLHQEELVRHQSSLVEQTFHETPTRQAFSSVSTELHELKQAMATTNSQLSVITRRTEPFSPSKCHPQAPSHWLNKPIRNLSPNFTMTSLSSCGPSPSSQPEAIPGPFFTSESGNNPIQPPVAEFLHALAAPPASASTPLPQSPSPNSLASTGSESARLAAGRHLSPVMYMPSPNPSNLLTLLIVPVSNAIYHILPLSLPASLGQPPPRTQQDLILPPCSAFPLATYPPFTTRDCTSAISGISHRLSQSRH